MEDNKLIVRTFGGFSMEWNGNMLTGGARSADTQLIRLLQLLLHYKEQGVDRTQLMAVLDEDSAADDVHHLLRSVLYNLRKKLKERGLPESRYIEFRSGRYFWTDDIPVLEDARHFEGVCREIAHELDADKKGELSLEACFLYRGDFLPQQTRLAWVSEEERRYSQMFKECAENAAEFLREKNDYAGLEKLGKHAAKVSPYNEWEVLTMEALITLGKYRDAQSLYEKTVDYYHKELGVRPSADMISRLDLFSTRLGYRKAEPADILKSLSETEIERGGFYCSYYVFQGIYRMIRRSMDRCGRYAYLMICTIVNNGTIEDSSSTSPDEVEMLKISENAKNVICNSIRRSDIICRYSMEQYLVILMNREIEGCYVVRDRINRNFKSKGYNITMEYDISPVREI